MPRELIRRLRVLAMPAISAACLLLLAGAPVFVTGSAAALGPQAAAAPSSAETTSGVTHILGFGDVKRQASGKLKVEGGVLRFQATAAGAAGAEVKVENIRDVFTVQDSRRMIGGTIGTVTRLAVPYGGGRVISLFRQGVDDLTVEYVDANGGLHGAIFTMPRGRAVAVKKLLVAQGAHVSIPIEEAGAPQKPGEGKPQ